MFVESCVSLSNKAAALWGCDALKVASNGGCISNVAKVKENHTEEDLTVKL